MSRWEGKPFGYLEGIKPADDAPVMDNPSQLYCRKCRAVGQLVCDEPGFCGNLEAMKPLPQALPDATVAPSPTKPQPKRRKRVQQALRPPQLDDSVGIQPLAGRRPPSRGIPELPGRIMGRRTELKITPEMDGQEQSWDWFMENVTPEGWPR